MVTSREISKGRAVRYARGVKLLDYHRLRNDEERSWDCERLRELASTAFCDSVEALLPRNVVHVWDPDQYVRFDRAPWFEACAELCDRYREATDAQRTWLRSMMDHSTGGQLGLFGLRAAVLGARERSPALIRTALIAFAIVDLAERDIRDVLIGFTLVCHCARLAGADVPALLREVAASAGPAMRTLFGEWAERYPDISGIGAMGWREVQTEEGVGFRMG